jgi:hypothetical protein
VNSKQQISCDHSPHFSEKIWRNTKIRSRFSHVIKAVEEAKKRKTDKLLRLPKSNREGIAAVVASESGFFLCC